MAYRLQFDSKQKVLLVIHEGEVHGWEIESLGDELRRQFSELNPSITISDFSTATTIDVDAEMIRHLAKKDGSFPTMRRFIVAPLDYMFGLARMYELSAHPPFASLQVVRSRADALAAIGPETLMLEPLVLAPLADL
ncbi:MAG TPA: hypothetical protein VKA07_03625 [Candidatus Sulfotelmatobacter sp.]|nr:hypothetical protein [Candidatus Sulfotelmatobacter sp.]